MKTEYHRHHPRQTYRERSLEGVWVGRAEVSSMKTDVRELMLMQERPLTIAQVHFSVSRKARASAGKAASPCRKPPTRFQDAAGDLLTARFHGTYATERVPSFHHLASGRPVHIGTSAPPILLELGATPGTMPTFHRAWEPPGRVETSQMPMSSALGSFPGAQGAMAQSEEHYAGILTGDAGANAKMEASCTTGTNSRKT